MGKQTISMVIFIAMLTNYQRVHQKQWTFHSPASPWGFPNNTHHGPEQRSLHHIQNESQTEARGKELQGLAKKGELRRGTAGLVGSVG